MFNLDLQAVEREPFVRRILQNINAFQLTVATAVFGPFRQCNKSVVQSGTVTLLTQTSGTTTVAIKKAVGTAAAVTIGTVSLAGAADVTGTAGPLVGAINFTVTTIEEGAIVYAQTTAAGTGGSALSVHIEMARDFS